MSNNKLCSFVVPGRSVPAVRMTQKTKWGKYEQRYLKYKSVVGWAARQSYKGKPVTIDVSVEVDIYLRGGNQGDIDNYFKSITDSLNKIIYKDDKQVKKMKARKIECDKNSERVEVSIYEI